MAVMVRFFRQYCLCPSVSCMLCLLLSPCGGWPCLNTRSAGGRDKNTRLAFQLSGHFRLESLEVLDDPPRLFWFVPVDMHPRQLVPAVRAHGLQLGVFLQGGERFIKALQPDQDQAQPVPSPVEGGA